MELKSEKLNACNFKRHIQTNTNVEADVIVPDSKPDIAHILTVKARADVTEKYIRKDKIIFSGNVRFNIIYVGDVDRNRMQCIEYETPFNFQTELNGADEQCMQTTAYRVIKTGFKIRNSRKINVEATIGFDTEIMKHAETEVICGTSDDESLPVILRKHCFDSASALKETEFTVTESFTIGADHENGYEICDIDARIDVSEIRTVNNKAVVKGGGVFTTLCMHSNEISSFENELTFTEICDLDGVNPEMSLSAFFTVTSCKCDTSPIGNEIGVEAEVTIKGYICAFEHCELTLADDMYDPDYKYEKKQSSVCFITRNGPYHSQTTIKDSVFIDESDTDISSVKHMNVICELKTTQVNGSNIIAEGYLHTGYIYSDSDNYLYPLNKDIPFRMEIPAENCNPDCDISVNLSVANYGYTVSSSREIQSRIILKAETFVSHSCKSEIITDFTSDYESPTDKSSQPSITICYPTEKDTMWTLAKKYNTTSETIARINNTEPDAQLCPGKPLIITKRLSANH